MNKKKTLAVYGNIIYGSLIALDIYLSIAFLVMYFLSLIQEHHKQQNTEITFGTESYGNTDVEEYKIGEVTIIHNINPNTERQYVSDVKKDKNGNIVEKTMRDKYSNRVYVYEYDVSQKVHKVRVDLR